MEFTLLTEAVNYLMNFIEHIGYIGIFLGMAIESSFFPFPSEIIMIPAGALAAQGKYSFFLVFLLGVLGSILGALINYFLAMIIGRSAVELLIDKYGKFLFISRKNLEKADSYFEKHGEITTFIGRLIPGIRQLISIPAGFSKMNLPRFILFTGLGAGIWSMILTSIGYFLGTNSDIINQYYGLFIFLIVFFSIIIILIYVLYKNKKSSKINKNIIKKK